MNWRQTLEQPPNGIHSSSHDFAGSCSVDYDRSWLEWAERQRPADDDDWLMSWRGWHCIMSAMLCRKSRTKSSAERLSACGVLSTSPQQFVHCSPQHRARRPSSRHLQWLKWFWEAGGGAHLTKPGWSKPHTHSNPTNSYLDLYSLLASTTDSVKCPCSVFR